MKKTLIISLLCFTAIGSYAQSNTNDDNAAERQAIKERADAIYRETNGNMGPGTEMHYKSNYSDVHAAYPDAPANAVPAWPSSSSQYTALQDPPCYKYKDKKGVEVMECPGARFQPEGGAANETATTLDQSNGGFNVTRERSYTGNYPDLHAIYPQAPANAVPATPSGPYTELQDPPCYKYRNARGLEVMECPGAQFAPEHDYR